MSLASVYGAAEQGRLSQNKAPASAETEDPAFQRAPAEESATASWPRPVAPPGSQGRVALTDVVLGPGGLDAAWMSDLEGS